MRTTQKFSTYKLTTHNHTLIVYFFVRAVVVVVMVFVAIVAAINKYIALITRQCTMI